MPEIGNHNKNNVPQTNPSIEDYSSMPLADFTESLNQTNLDWRSLNKIAQGLAANKETDKAVLVYKKVQEITSLQIANELGATAVGIDRAYIGRIGDKGEIVRYKKDDLRKAEIKINASRFDELTLEEGMATLMWLNKIKVNDKYFQHYSKLQQNLTSIVENLIISKKRQSQHPANSPIKASNQTENFGNFPQSAFQKITKDRMDLLTPDEAAFVLRTIPVQEHGLPMAMKLKRIINKVK
jgi:hypothetical protein